MDFLGSIGKFLGGLFGGNNNSDEEKRRKEQQAQQATQRQAAPQQTPVFGQPNAQIPGVTNPPEKTLNPVLLGTQPQTGAPELLKKAQPKVIAQPAPQENPLVKFGKNVVSGIQQGVGDVADVAVRGGGVLNDVGVSLNPLLSKEQKDKQYAADFGTSEKLIKAIKDTKTVTGESFNPKADYQPTGDFGRDATTLAGRGLQTGLDATTFINPGRLLAKSAAGVGLKDAAVDTVKSALGIGGTQGVATGAQTFGETGDLKKAAQAGLESAALSAGGQAVLGLGGNIAGTGLKKAVAALRPNEVAPGIVSANPSREVDAAAAVAAKQAEADKQAAITLAAQAENAPKPTVTPAPAPAAPAIEPTPVAPVVQPPVAAVAPEAPVPPVAPQPAAAEIPVPPVAPVVDPNAPPVMPNVAPSGAPVDVAPRTHDALVQQMGPAVKEQKGKYSQRTPINLEDLKAKAEGVVANMDDNAVLNSFATTGPETMITDSNSFAIARAALNRLAQSENPAAAQTVTNIMDAMERYVSKSGEGLRIVQEEFDNMPLPMKVRYIVKKIDSANADTKDYQPLRDNPEKAAQIEADITDRLTASQAISERVAAIEGQLNSIAESAKNGEKTAVNTDALINSLRNERRSLAANNGELAKYFQDFMPKASRGQRINDFARRMMLGSFTGRVNDLLTTAGNVANLGAQNFTQGILAKAVNLFSPGKVTDTLKGGRQFAQGTVEGVLRGGTEFGGTQYANDLQKALTDNTEARTGLKKATGPVGKVIQAATEFATKASAGVTDQRLYQLAAQEGQQAGLKGRLLDEYAKARAAVPSHQMQADAEQLHMELNNLNENPISRGLNRVAAGIEGKSAIGGFLKNQIMPFTSWLGGNIYNSVTDKNVVASMIKTVDSAVRGDAEGVVRNLAKTANNAAYTYALGYLLTQAGVITNQDAEGYNDAGAYFHIGDRYVPVGFAGFFAPSIVLGNAAYNGLNDGSGGSPAEKIVNAAGTGIMNLAKSMNIGGAIGAETNVARSYQAATRPGGDVADAAATFGGGAAGQFIPAITGDINAVLNNGIPGIQGSDALNPTHEKANTKVTDPNSPSGNAKDVPASALETLKNRVPILSQSLPRKAGVSAQDLVDRTTRGNRDTSTGITARADEKVKTDQTKDFKSRGVPDPNTSKFDDAVKSRVESGEYDKAIEGLNAKITANNKDTNIPKSTTKKLEDQVKQLTVTKDGKYDPSVIQTYKDTSLTEWRDMGDPKSDTYDPKTYQLLFNYDSDLANAGVSRNNTKADRNFFSAKADKKSSGRGSAESVALAKIKSNTLGSTPTLSKVSFGDLAPQKAGSVKMPTLQQVKPGELIKKRAISVKKG